MDDLLQKETERQRRLLEDARKAVEQEKARMRQGGARRVEPKLDEPTAAPAEPAQRRSEFQEAPQQAMDSRSATGSSETVEAETLPSEEFVARLRSIPDMRSALIPLDENPDGTLWSKPFSLQRADMEPWLSYLRGYRASCLFPESASLGSGLRVDAAVQALLELKGIDVKVILEPAVQINGPVEYFDDAQSDDMHGNERSVHQSQLAKAVEKGREMGNHLYDALLGEGYVNLVQAWEKVHSRKPSVSELHFMLTTGRVKPPVEIQPRRPEMSEGLYPPKAPAATIEADQPKQEATLDERKASRLKASTTNPKLASQFGSKLKAKFVISDKRKLIFHLSHLALVCIAVLVYCVVMRVFE